jgi:hypothetical protein
VPGGSVAGIVGVAEAVPPVAAGPYQLSVFPVMGVAVKEAGTANWQYVTGTVLTVGAAGLDTVVTVTLARALSHPLLSVWLT